MVKDLTINTVQRTTDWFKEAKPNPTKVNVIQQFSYFIEELVELFEATNDVDVAEYLTSIKQDYLKAASNGEDFANEIISGWKKLDVLDALCDINVTTNGVATYLGMDFVGASNEVENSNWSKFDDNGKAIIDEEGKITKGPNYFKPKLEPFI